MTKDVLKEKYLSEKEVGLDGPFVGCLVRLRSGDQTAQMLFRRLAPDVRIIQSNVHAFIEAGNRLSSMDCPNLLKIIELGIDNEGLYLVTEYPRHLSLMNLLGRLTVPSLQAVMIVEQAARALAATSTLIHGTLTPQDLWITSTGVIKVKDFGLYLLLQDPLQVISTASSWLDTEVCAGLKPDESADCSALGRILVALLYGGAIKKKSSGSCEFVYREDFLKNVPDDCKSILARCLHPDRSQRYHQARELLSSLDDFLSQKGATDPVDGLESFLRQRAKRTNFEQNKKYIYQLDHNQEDSEDRGAEHFRQSSDSSLIDPSTFWKAERGEDSGDGGDSDSQELSVTQAQGLLKLSQEGNIPLQPELLYAFEDSKKSADSVPSRAKHFDLSFIPTWLQVIAGIAIAAVIGGLAGWYLIGQWTVVEVQVEGDLRGETIPVLGKVEKSIQKEVRTPHDESKAPDEKSPVAPNLTNAPEESLRKMEPSSIEQSRDKCFAGCGWIYITTVPPKATVELDGNEVPGTTPLLINDVGANDSHVLRVVVLGMKPYKQNVIVKKGEVLNLDIELK
jgi:hypothetical protein